jgi:superfamily II DNA or RNA helicase
MDEYVFTSKGYRIPVQGNKEHMKALIVKSESKLDYPGPKPTIICYRRSKEWLYLPRYYGIKTFGMPTKRHKENPTTIELGFNGELRGYQKDVIDKTMVNFKTIRGGIWSCQTGTGKTIMALKLISLLGLKTIIIVHKQVLLDQWRERIRHFLPNAKVGLIQAGTIDVDGKDIILAMIQSLTRKEYQREIFKDIGLTIVDECHCICSRTFSEVFFMIQTPYRIGLSATPKRKDGFDKVIEYHLGPIIVEVNGTIIQPEILTYDVPEVDEIEVKFNKFGKVNMPKLITDLAGSDKRNAFITGIIMNLVKEDRKILVFSDRVYQCERLNEFFLENAKKMDISKTSDTFIGKKKKPELDEALKKDVIFATYGICKEGFDCPELDTLVFGTPKSDVIQAVGRILRQKNKNVPVVIDIVDRQFHVLKTQFYIRKRWYKKKNFLINGESEGHQKMCLIR